MGFAYLFDTLKFNLNLVTKNASKETLCPNLTPLPLLIPTATMGYSQAAPSCQSGVECCINVTSACAPTHTDTLCLWCWASSCSQLNCHMRWRQNHVAQSSLATVLLHKTCSGWRLWSCIFVEAPLVWHTVVAASPRKVSKEPPQIYR